MGASLVYRATTVKTTQRNPISTPLPPKISKTKYKTPYLSINKKQSLKTTKKAARDNDKEQTATEGNGTVTLSTAQLLLD